MSTPESTEPFDLKKAIKRLVADLTPFPNPNPEVLAFMQDFIRLAEEHWLVTPGVLQFRLIGPSYGGMQWKLELPQLDPLIRMTLPSDSAWPVTQLWFIGEHCNREAANLQEFTAAFEQALRNPGFIQAMRMSLQTSRVVQKYGILRSS